MSDANDRQETIADIADEIKRAVESMGDEIPYTTSVGTMRRVADRINAAWRRERAKIEAQALSIGGIVESSRHKQKPQGNAAALREAVVALLDTMYSLGCDEDTATLAAFVPDMADSSAKCLAAFRKAKDALSAPARNCDMYDNWYDAHQAWERLPKDELGYFVDANGVHECEQAWLFAPAEWKGEGDGK